MGRGILAVLKRELRMDPMDRAKACSCWLKAFSAFLGQAVQTFEERSLIARDRPARGSLASRATSCPAVQASCPAVAAKAAGVLRWPVERGDWAPQLVLWQF